MKMEFLMIIIDFFEDNNGIFHQLVINKIYDIFNVNQTLIYFYYL